MERHQRFQPREKKQQLSVLTSTELPLRANVGVYARQSTQMQVRYATNSTEMQTDDLVNFARRLGWDDDKIIVFTQDLGVSGRLRIDEREGLRTLVSHIEEGTIKAVIVFLEDRLFRDETQIQVNTFISICRQHGVLVITPAMTYNFNNRFHVKEFRWKCEAAADYITDYVMARLVGAKQKVSERGEYDGRALPAGYILDRREWLIIDGVQVHNKGYKKYMIYKPHADIVMWLFDRYLMVGGNLSQLCREIMSMSVLFPDFAPDVDARNVSKLELKKVEGGYHITNKGLKSLLTNVSYIGWWVYQGEIRLKDNHPPIVEENVFWYAFNQLSTYGIDGERNKNVKQPVRYYQGDGLKVQALLKNIISTEFLGAVYVSGSGSASGRWFYGLYEKDVSLLVQCHTVFPVSVLDNIYIEKLVGHLKRTKDFSHYKEYASEEYKKAQNELVSVQRQIDEIDQQCLGLMMSLKKATLDERLREALEREYADLQVRRSALMKKVEAPVLSTNGRKLLAYSDLINKLAPHWEKLLFDDRKMLVEALTESVLLDILAPHWLRLVIKWRDPAWGSDEALIWRNFGASVSWSEDENKIVREGYSSYDQDRLLSFLPQRSWGAIHNQAHVLGVSRSKQLKYNSPIPRSLTYLDWRFMQEQGIVYSGQWENVRVLWL